MAAANLAAKPVAPTISTVFDCACWYEREIREFFGVTFEGHPNMTYLFLHEGIDYYPLRKGQIPVSDEDKRSLGSFRPGEGEDTFSINLGPQHPSTHGVLRVVLKMDGEYIEEADPVLGYLHRMHEKMAENRGYLQFLANTGRMDYLGAMAFNLGYVTAVERLCGIAVPDRPVRWFDERARDAGMRIVVLTGFASIATACAPTPSPLNQSALERVAL